VRQLDIQDNDPTDFAACPFCEIAAGRMESDVVCEDDYVVCFLDRSPATPGHVLVVSRKHRRDIWEITPEEGAAAFGAARLLAEVARNDLGAAGVNLKQNNGSKAGQDVFHFHLHVVPRYTNDTVLPGCVWGVPPWEPPTSDDEERRHIAETIRRGIAARSASRTSENQ
jgi:histidine triad (HIT) family protein